MFDPASIEPASEADFQAARTMAAFRSEKHRRAGRVKHLRGPSTEKRTLLHKPICAIDGEGMTLHDHPADKRCSGCPHHYTLLAATWPSGRAKMEAHSLCFDDCMRFILSLPDDHCYVIFGGNYDENMMLRSLPKDTKNKLLDTGEVGYYSEINKAYYKIKWVERKFFRVSSRGVSRTIYDVLANFQMPFVDPFGEGRGVCEAWNVGTQEQLAMVRAMKAKRGTFAEGESSDIEDYCFLECELLAEVCRKFFDTILETPYRPRAVYGPGALASAAMEKHGIKRFMDDLPEPLDTLTRYAYFGGRFDCSVFGWFSDVVQYDIKSAYPDQIRYLPCLKHGAWKKHTYADYQARGLPQWGMMQVEWLLPSDTLWPPFPHRDAQGNVRYPYKGKGWYHAEEVKAALEMYPDNITFITGWAFERECDHVPFDFVDDLFKRRQQMTYEQGYIFKLILNSLYGKTAQQVGAKPGKRPTWQCLFWAGAITSGTRAKLLRAIRQCPDSVLGVATDSIVSKRRLDLPISGELGDWETNDLAEYAQISNGIYHAVDRTGKSIERSRGFGRASLDWNYVHERAVKTRLTGKVSFVTKPRFITIKEARNRIDRAFVECRWIAQDRSISFWPSRRYPGEYSREGPTRVLEPLDPTDHPSGSYESQPFRLKSSREVIEGREQWNAYAWQDYA